MAESAGLRFRYCVEHHDLDGNLVWRREFDNLVTTAGKNLLGNIVFGATAKSAAWYLGLKGAGTAAVGDTMSSHAGWSEVTAYDEATREVLTLASFSSGTANNSGSAAVFTINASVTVAGVFCVDNSTKGGTGGTLYSAGDFSGGSVTLSSGTLTVNAFALAF
jgi:hypothetical protein